MHGKKKEVKVVENHVIVKGCHEKMMKLKDKGNTYRAEMKETSLQSVTKKK